MTTTSRTYKEMRIDAQGRAVFPAELRHDLGFKEGERLIPRVVDGKILLERREDIRRRLQSIFPKDGPSPVAELMAERRAEAERE